VLRDPDGLTVYPLTASSGSIPGNTNEGKVWIEYTAMKRGYYHFQVSVWTDWLPAGDVIARPGDIDINSV
jgi:hypothetical protein